MFHKEFKVKSNSSIKGSERKKLRSDISLQYPILSSDDLNTLVPSRDEMNQMKIYTHSGQVVKVYFLGVNPVFFQSETHLFPTVYTLWKHPDLLPTFSTWPPVLENLSNGADLMLPGVVLTEGIKATDRLQSIKTGDACAICLVGNRAPVAVGTSALSSKGVFGLERRGKAVIVAHVYGDKLWVTGDKSQPVQLDEERPFSDEEAIIVPEGGDEVEVLCDQATNGIGDLSLEQTELEECLPEKGIPEKTSTELMDEVLMNCFLTAMKTSMKKTELPLLTSTFYSAHVLAACSPDAVLDIKKSSYKKVSPFLDEMNRQGVIQIKELSKGVKSIVGVNFDHEMVKRFKLVKVAQAEQRVTSDEAYAPPLVKDLYCVSAAVMPLFKDRGVSKGTPFTAGEVRQRLTDYVKQNELQIPESLKEVRLDPLLTSVLLSKAEYMETLTWDDLFSRTLSKMTKAHEIQFPGKAPIFRKGPLEPVDIAVVQRTGNKKVTLVYNLEHFGIEPETFAHQVQLGVAASTSVSAAPNSKKGTQVLVQGNQVRFVGKLLLDEYKLPRKYIQGLDKAPSKNKK